MEDNLINIISQGNHAASALCVRFPRWISRGRTIPWRRICLCSFLSIAAATTSLINFPPGLEITVNCAVWVLLFCWGAKVFSFFRFFLFIKRKFSHWKEAKWQRLRLIFGFLGFSLPSQSSKRQQIEGSHKVWPLLSEDQDLQERKKKRTNLRKRVDYAKRTHKKLHRIAGIKRSHQERSFFGT